MNIAPKRTVTSWPATSHPLLAEGRAVATFALALGVGSHAINGFVTTAVLPDIIRELGGQNRAFWVFSSFEMLTILAGCLTGAIKVRFGTRTPFLFATATLAAGSVVAGLSPSLEGLIAGRAMQGFGEGMIVALCYALIPVLYPNTIAPRIFALLSGVWAMAAGLGPVSAGLLTEAWSWRAAFLVNIPLTIVLFAMINTALPAGADTAAKSDLSSNQPGRNRLPLRLGLLILCILALTLIGEVRHPVMLVGMVSGGLLLGAFLLKIDHASPLRLFPSDAFRARTLIGLGTWIIFLVSIAASARSIFVTTFGQVYWDLSVTQASYVAACLAFAWTAFAWISARAPSRQVELVYLVVGPVLIVSGLTLTAVSVMASSLPLFIAAAVVAGAGHGLYSQILMRSLMYNAEGAEQGLVSSILPTINSAGIAIGGGVTALLAIVTGLVSADSGTLVTKTSIAEAGPSLFFINAGLTVLPAAAMLVLRARIIRKEAATPAE